VAAALPDERRLRPVRRSSALKVRSKGDDLGQARDRESVSDQSPNELRGEAKSAEGGDDGIADLDGTRGVRWTEEATRADEYGAWPIVGMMGGVPGVPAGGFGTLKEQRAEELHGGTVVLAGGPAGWDVGAEEALKGLSRCKIGIDESGSGRDEDESGCANGLHSEDVRTQPGTLIRSPEGGTC